MLRMENERFCEELMGLEEEINNRQGNQNDNG